MKRFFIPLAALFSLVAPALTRAAPPIYPGVVPYEQLDTRNFYLGNYPILRIMPFMPKDTPPYLPVDTWSFAVNTNLWTLYAYDPPNTTWHQVLGLGGIAVTINPTDNYTPYRIDATTFGDSMLRYRASGSDLGAPTAGGGTSVYAGGADGIFNFGYQAGQNGDFTGSLNVFNFGYQAGQNGIWDNVVQSYNIGDGAGSNSEWRPTANNIFNFGDLAGSSAIFKNSSEIYNLGTYAGASQKLTNSYSIYSEGSGAGQQIIATSANTVYNFGEDAGREMTLATVSDLYNIGYRANFQQSFTGKSHMVALGSGAKTTNTDDFVFGDIAYNYWFPGEIYSELAFGPGRTNVLYRSGTDLIYTNGLLGGLPVSLKLVDGTGKSGELAVSGNTVRVAPGASGNAVDLWDRSEFVRLGGGKLWPLSSGVDLGGVGTTSTDTTWHDIQADGTNFVFGFHTLAGTNNVSVNEFMEGDIAVFDIRSLTNGVNGPINRYSFRTNGVEILSIVGPGGGGGLLSQLLWTNSPTGGGSLTASSNVIASLPTGLYGSIFNNSEDIFAAGENAGQGQAVIQSTNLYNIGLLSGYGMTGNEAWMVMNIGDAAGRSATIYNSQDVYNFGIAPGELAQITNGSWVVMNIGDNAGYAMVTDKSQDIFNYGWLSGDSMGVSNSIAIFNYGDWAGKNPVSTIQNSQDIFNYGNAAGGDQIPHNSTNLFNYGLYAGGAQFVQTVNSYYNYGTDSGYMGVGLASNSEELYNYGAWAGASLAALVADGTFMNFTNVYNYGPEAGMQIKGTNATYVLNYGYRAGEQSTMTGVSDLYNYGSDSGYQSTYDTSATDIYNYGTSAGKGASYTNAFFILNSGNSAGQSMVAQDSSSILNLGSYAGANMVATNSSSIVNIGPYAGNLENVTNSTYIFSYGDRAGNLLIANNSSADIFNYGHDAGKSMVADGSTDIYNFGENAGNAMILTNGAADIFNYGSGSGTGMTADDGSYVFNYGIGAGNNSLVLDNTAAVFNYGDTVGQSMTLTNGSYDIFSYGNQAGNLSLVDDCDDIFLFGEKAGNTMVTVGSYDIYAYGYQALSQAQLTNSSQIYALGNNAGASLTGDGYSDIYLFGTAQPTRKTNEFVFGSANYLVTIPGHVNGDIVNAINVKAPPYNAKGDSVTDDTAAIQAALDSAGAAPVFFPAGTYKVTGSGAACLTLNKNRDIFGSGGVGTIIRADAAGAATDLLRIAITNNYGLTDIRNFRLSDMTLFFNGGGRHGLIITNGLPMLVSKIYNINVGGTEANSGVGIKVEGSAGGYAFNTIENCNVNGGIYIADGGDGVRIRDNVISATGIGIKFDSGVGTRNSIIEHNTITTRDSAIDVVNASKLVIFDNQIEQAASLNQSLYQQLIFVEGTTYTADSIDIINNNLGGGLNVGNSIVLSNAINTQISCNRMYATLTNDVLMLAASATNYVSVNNAFYGGTRPTARFNGIITDLGTGNNKGDLVGPTVVIDRQIPVYDGTTGRQVTNSDAVMTSTGFFGVGLTNPVATLHTKDLRYGNPTGSGTSETHNSWRLQSGSVALDTGIYATGTSWSQARNSLNLFQNYDMVFEPLGGNVGIGTNAPSENLEVLSNIKANGVSKIRQFQDGYTNVLTSATGKDFFYVSVPNTNMIGGQVIYQVACTDGTDSQSVSGRVTFDAVAKSTTVTANTSDVQNSAICTGGSTLTAALAKNVATNNVFALGITATTSLTTTNLLVKWRVEIPGTVTVNAIP